MTIITDLLNDLLETLNVITERQNRTFDGRHQRSERQQTALIVVRPCLEAVLQQRVHNATNAKGRFDYVWIDRSRSVDCASRNGMLAQIVGGTIGAASTLDPALQTKPKKRNRLQKISHITKHLHAHNW